MKIDPKKIAKLISEDPNVAPDDHFDDFEDEYIDPDAEDAVDMAECGNCGIEFNPNTQELSMDNEELNHIYSEVNRLSDILYTSGYYGWWFCSSSCAREQRDKLKIEIEHNS